MSSPVTLLSFVILRCSSTGADADEKRSSKARKL